MQIASRFLNRHTPPNIMTLVLITGLAALSLNIFLPSLPDMARHFQTEYAIMQIAVSGYLAATAFVQLIVGPLSDRFGRRPVMLGALIIFIAASAVCVLAPTVEIFMAARLAQAAIAAGFVLARAIVRDMVPAEEAASMIGYVTMGMAVVPMLGPSVGGALSDMFGWQSGFAVLTLCGLLVLFLGFSDLGETNRQKSSSFTSQFHSWPLLLGSGRFWAYVLVSTFASGTFFCFLGGAPFVGSVIFGLSPSTLGVHFFSMACGYMVGNFMSGRYARRIGIGNMMIIGCIVCVGGVLIALILPWFGIDNEFAFFIPLSLIGVGNGVSLPSANAGMLSVKPELAGSASGLGGAITLGGGAALSILASSLLSAETGALPLLLVMLTCGILGTLVAQYIRHLDRRPAQASVATP